MPERGEPVPFLRPNEHQIKEKARFLVHARDVAPLAYSAFKEEMEARARGEHAFASPLTAESDEYTGWRQADFQRLLALIEQYEQRGNENKNP